MPDHLPTIRALKARCVDVPLSRPLRTAVGGIAAAPLVLVDVETSQGVTGRAYAFVYTQAAMAPVAKFLENIAGELEGKSISPAERAKEFEHRFRLMGRQGFAGMALSGLDMALWDALGRTQNLPVVRLLGGEPVSVPAYDSYGIVDPVEDRKALEDSLAQGFRAIKIKIGERDLRHDVETVAAVRDILGPDVALMVDYNQSRDAQEAIRRIERIAEYDIAWVEEPVPAEDFQGHARVRAASPVPIQTGENWWFASDMAKALAAGACDYAMPDIMKIGGVTGWLRAMGLAEAESIPVSSHLFVEASAHVLPVTPTAHWLEYLGIANAVMTEPLAVEDGRVTARGPGLGMEWDEKAVARYSV